MISDIKIEKGFPAPNAGAGGRKEKYPWSKMKVGDSFFVPGKRIQQFGSHAWHAGRLLRMKFACRTQNGGVRVWRIY
jgi:hypothetical protein